MDIWQEVKSYAESCEDESCTAIKANLGTDSWKKVGAILRTLEIGSPNIAHSKLILHVCEDMLEKCSVTMGTQQEI